jgi:CobQ-like glutamine amidotransferase family enzyme
LAGGDYAGLEPHSGRRWEMDEQMMQDALAEMLTGLDVNLETDGDGMLEIRRVATFEDAGVLTRNRGLVVRLADGSEFQITIVQSA